MRDRDRYYAKEILRHAAVIASIVARGKAEVEQDDVARYAIEHAVELLAEAAGKVSNPFKTVNPEIRWAGLRMFRREVAHPYDTGKGPVAFKEVWLFASVEAPKIARKLRRPDFTDSLVD